MYKTKLQESIDARKATIVNNSIMSILKKENTTIDKLAANKKLLEMACLQRAEIGDDNDRKHVGLMYLKGDFGKVDEKKGFYWLEKAGREDIEAIYFIGEYLSDQNRHKEAFPYFVRCVDLGFEPAIGHLAQLYIFGMGIEKDTARGISLMKRLMELRPEDKDLYQLMGSSYYEHGDIENAMFWFELAYEEDCIRNKFLIRICEYYTTEENYKEAFKYSKALMERGEPRGKIMLGTFYINGDGCKKDIEKGLRFIKECIKSGDMIAAMVLAKMYKRRNITEDKKLAFEMYVKYMEMAARKGVPEAIEALAYTTEYEHNLEFIRVLAEEFNDGKSWYALALHINQFEEENEENDKRIFKYIKKAADAGWKMAYNDLGKLYRDGEGVTQSLKQAHYWLEKGVEVGSGAAAFNLGSLYAFGIGAPQNPKKARECFKKAIENECLNGWYGLGHFAQDAIGEDQDHKKAFECFSKTKDHPEATREMALYLAEGKVCRKNKKKAVKLIKEAAEMGDIIAERLVHLLE